MPASSGDPPGALAISEVARLTGLTSTTLRVWQRRYGLGASRSSPGGHRRPAGRARARPLLPELADPGVLTALPSVDRLVAAGPGWDGVDLPEGIERVGDLPGALRIVEEAFQPGDPGTKRRRRSVSRR